MLLDADISTLSGVGPALAQKFGRLEIYSLRDLLYTFPRDYLDYSKISLLSEINTEFTQTAIVEVVKFRGIFLRGPGRRTMQRALLRDSSGEVEAIWFNMPFLEKTLVEGQKLAITARLSYNKKTQKPQLVSPNFEKYAEGQTLVHMGRIVPVYRLSEGISPKKYRQLILQILDNVDLVAKELISQKKYYLSDSLTEKIKAKLPNKTFISHVEALKTIHFPDNYDELENAKFRLGVDEIVPIQEQLLKEALVLGKSKSLTSMSKRAGDISVDEYWQKFSFEPTEDQVTTTEELAKDFYSGKPMFRMIQGDVGSGKTAVAGFAAALTLAKGFDVIFMVPTTVLANQHFETLNKIFPAQVELVVAGSDLNQIVARRTNDPLTGRIYLGTQALLHHYQDEGMNLRIGTVIVDEEHRFGVKQREEIAELTKIKSDVIENATAAQLDEQQILPNYLTLTATPIPRSLALSLFGNIELSVISTKPKQQLPKITYLVPEHKREDSYEWVRQLVKKDGYQIFWICPLIEVKKEVEDTPVIISKGEKASVEKVYEQLVDIFPDLRIEKLHGKLKPKAKEEILQNFKDGGADILVSTTVIEVGIDIPNANLIAIENAERFGLAQLHQLRGRVGRGSVQGYCLLFSSQDQPAERLKVFSQQSDGLKLAEYDLQQRGPGEVYGNQQSGLPLLKIANILDTEQIQIARMIAENNIGL